VWTARGKSLVSSARPRRHGRLVAGLNPSGTSLVGALALEPLVSLNKWSVF